MFLKIKTYYLILFFLSFVIATQAQSSTSVEELLRDARYYHNQNDLKNSLRYYLPAIRNLEKEENIEALAKIYQEVGEIYFEGNLYEKSSEYFQKALQIEASAYNFEKIGINFQYLEQYDKALEAYFIALESYRNEENQYAQLSVLRNIVTTYKSVQAYPEALEYNFQILEIYEKLNQKEGMAVAYNNIGYNYKFLKKYNDALKYFEKTLALKEELNQTPSEKIVTLVNIAIVHQNMGEYENSLKNALKALKIAEKNNNPKELAQLYDLISVLYFNAGDYYNAKIYNQKALALAQPYPEISQMTYNTASLLYQAEGDYKKALDAFSKHLEIRDSLRLEERLKQQELLEQQFIIERAEKELELLLVDQEIQEFTIKQLELESEKQQQDMQLLQREKELQGSKLEAEELEKQRALQELLLARRQVEAEKKDREIKDLEKNKKLQALALKQKEAEEKKKQQEIALLTKNKQIQDLELKRQEERIEKQNTFRNFLIGLVSLGIILIILAFVAVFITRKKNRQLDKQKKEIQEKNVELIQSQEEVAVQRDALAKTSEELREVNQDITASIRYAQRIQEAMLPPMLAIQTALPESFIFYKPRDIVSGDFYWFNQSEGGKKVIAAVDCTGHGVPGAFMSMVGNDILNETVTEKHITTPSKILERLHKGIVKALKQNTTENRDGMDIALLCIDKETKMVEFAGANNPVVYIQDKQLYEIRGDKMPIGGTWQKNETSRIFTNQEIKVDKPTVFYIFSDGFQDQFGGEYDKKFMKGNFKKLLLEIHQKPFSEQEKILNKTFEDWKGSSGNQVDDVMVIGFRLS